MDINEVREARFELASRIAALLQEFTNKSGCVVSSICIDTMQHRENKRTLLDKQVFKTIYSKVDLEVKL